MASARHLGRQVWGDLPWPTPIVSWLPVGVCGRLSPHSDTGCGRFHFIHRCAYRHCGNRHLTWGVVKSTDVGSDRWSHRASRAPDGSLPARGPLGLRRERGGTPARSGYLPDSSDSGESVWCGQRTPRCRELHRQAPRPENPDWLPRGPRRALEGPTGLGYGVEVSEEVWGLCREHRRENSCHSGKAFCPTPCRSLGCAVGAWSDSMSPPSPPARSLAASPICPRTPWPVSYLSALEPNPGRFASAAGAPGAVVAEVDGPAVALPLAEGLAKMSSTRVRKTGKHRATSGAPCSSEA